MTALSEAMNNPVTPASLPLPGARRAWVLAVTSGKGGVGKTFVSANVAAALARRGHRVLVLDADLGLANLDVVLNLYPKITLHDVFTGKATLDEAVLKAPGGFSVLLAGSGLVEYSRLTPEVREQLQRVVATPEPTSLTDAYATIKVLASQQRRRVLHMAVNQVGKPGDGKAVTHQLQQVVDRFVTTPQGDPVKLVLVGDIPTDASVREALQRRQLLFESLPGSAAARIEAAAPASASS
jgi:flagellar biosynthesis protein FlhG